MLQPALEWCCSFILAASLEEAASSSYEPQLIRCASNHAISSSTPWATQRLSDCTCVWQHYLQHSMHSCWDPQVHSVCAGSAAV
jgi:hypothetical protein